MGDNCFASGSGTAAVAVLFFNPECGSKDENIVVFFWWPQMIFYLSFLQFFSII